MIHDLSEARAIVQRWIASGGATITPPETKPKGKPRGRSGSRPSESDADRMRRLEPFFRRVPKANNTGLSDPWGKATRTAVITALAAESRTGQHTFREALKAWELANRKP